MSRLPGAPSGRWSETPDHESDHDPFDHGFKVRRQAFVVADEAASAHQPELRPFHHPAAWQQLNGALPLGFAHDLGRDAAILLGPGDEPARAVLLTGAANPVKSPTGAAHQPTTLNRATRRAGT